MTCMREGDKYPDGLTLTFTRGFAESVYACACGRMQCAKTKDQPDGISVEFAEALGWQKLKDAGWSCSFCTGSQAKLSEHFGVSLYELSDYGFKGRR